MRTLFSIILGSTILFSFAQCGNSKEMAYKLQEKSPFKITKVYYQEWVAGIQGGGSGVDVYFIFSDLDTDKITIDNIFFRGQKANVETNNKAYIGRFKTNINQKPDIIMSSQTDDEYGNKVPQKKAKFPFDLEKDEAVIGYREKGKQKYLKLKLLRGESPQYP